MSSWYIFTTLGLYPVAGQDLFVLTSPSVSHSVLQLGGGKTLSIVTQGWDAGGINRYIQSATLNDVPLDAAWLRGDTIRKGGTLKFIMGSTPSIWGHDHRPPSLSDAGSQPCKTSP